MSLLDESLCSCPQPGPCSQSHVPQPQLGTGAERDWTLAPRAIPVARQLHLQLHWLSLPVAATEVNLSLCFKNYGLTNPVWRGWDPQDGKILNWDKTQLPSSHGLHWPS